MTPAARPPPTGRGSSRSGRPSSSVSPNPLRPAAPPPSPPAGPPRRGVSAGATVGVAPAGGARAKRNGAAGPAVGPPPRPCYFSQLAPSHEQLTTLPYGKIATTARMAPISATVPVALSSGG
jgi:hypothetical protein